MCSKTIKFRQENRRRKRWREITTHFVLLLIVFGYSFIGAKLFQSIEEKCEQRAKGNLIKSKHNFIDQIKHGVGSQLVDQKNWTRMVDKLLNYYVEDLAEATSHGVDITDVTQHEYESASKWDFWGSLYYAGTVYTTIGYGNFAPVTPEGKVATIIYGTIGIPLCLILLADIGSLIARLIKCSVKKIKKQWYPKSKKNLRELWPPQDEIDTMTGKSAFVVLCVVSLLYFAIGTIMYRTWEDGWSNLDAAYFIFVSTSTIGFGDVLPNHPKKFIFSSIYVFIGLSLLSSGFTILQDVLESRITKAKDDLDSVIGIQKQQHEVDGVSTAAEETQPTEEATPGKQETVFIRDESMPPLPNNESTRCTTSSVGQENILPKAETTPDGIEISSIQERDVVESGKDISLGSSRQRAVNTTNTDDSSQEVVPEQIVAEESIVQQSASKLSAPAPKVQATAETGKMRMGSPSALSKLRNRKSPGVNNLQQLEPTMSNKRQFEPIASNKKYTKHEANNNQVMPSSSGSKQLDQPPAADHPSDRPGNARVSETTLVSLDDGVLSVEATIILD